MDWPLAVAGVAGFIIVRPTTPHSQSYVFADAGMGTPAISFRSRRKCFTSMR